MQDIDLRGKGSAEQNTNERDYIIYKIKIFKGKHDGRFPEMILTSFWCREFYLELQ